MMKWRWLLILAMLLSGMAAGQEFPRGEELARSNGCFICHSVDQKMAGPSFRQIARKYRGRMEKDPDLERKLAASIRYGASHGGSLAMPSYRRLSDGALDTMIHWILSSDERTVAYQ